MNTKTLSILFILAMSSLLFVTCSSSDDEPTPINPGGNGGDVTISSTSPDWPFWGSELTINGTGFSTVKEENIVVLVAPKCADVNYTSDGGDVVITSASATQLKVIVPFKRNTFGDCGPDRAQVIVKVKDKSDTTDYIKMTGPPRLGFFNYHYGWDDMLQITRIGDSVMIDGGITGDYAKESPYWDKVRLTINGGGIPMKYRKIGNKSGWAFFLSIEDFGEVNCGDESNGWHARPFEFKMTVDGTTLHDEKDMMVQYRPENRDVKKVSGKVSVSKAGDLNPEWVFEGKYLYYNKVRFVPQGECAGGPVVESEISPGGFYDRKSFGIPVGSMSTTCIYSISLVTPCDEFATLGSIQIKP